MMEDSFAVLGIGMITPCVIHSDYASPLKNGGHTRLRTVIPAKAGIHHLLSMDAASSGA